VESPQTTQLLLGISGTHAEELAVEIGIRDKLIGSLHRSGKQSLASILYRPLGRAVAFRLTASANRVEWESFEGEASQVHQFFQQLSGK
jgi:hypothetical protein